MVKKTETGSSYEYILYIKIKSDSEYAESIMDSCCPTGKHLKGQSNRKHFCYKQILTKLKFKWRFT